MKPALEVMEKHALPNDIEKLKCLVLSWQENYLHLLEQFRLAKLRHYGSSSEKKQTFKDIVISI